MRWKIDQTDKMQWLMVELKTKVSRVAQFVHDQLPAHIQPWSQTNQGPVAPNSRQTNRTLHRRCPLLRLPLQPELCLHASPVNHLQPAAVSRQTAKPISVRDTRPQSFSTTLQTFRYRARTTTTKPKACRLEEEMASWVVCLGVVFPVQSLSPDWICTWGYPMEDAAKSTEFARV